MSKCPNCGDEFDSESGMYKHHYMVHPTDWKFRFEKQIPNANKSECWEWQGKRGANGYGEIGIGGDRYYAHRLSYRIEYGVIPKPQVNHHCDNSICVNPEHLYSGTQKENMNDIANRNKQSLVTVKKGVENHASKLDPASVREIRQRLSKGESCPSIAEDYEVKSDSILAIKNRENWTHV